MAKLGRYHAPQMSDVGKNYRYFFSDAIGATADDVTSIANIHAHGGDTKRDYKFWRDEIKRLVREAGGGDVDAGFDTLSTTEKQICCKHNIASKSKQKEVYGLETLIELGEAYRQRVQAARQKRIGVATNEVWNRLSEADAETVLNDVEAGNLWQDFAVFGREGTEEGDATEGIADYIHGRTGTTWENDGLKDYAWTPDGLADMQALADLVYDIIINGKY